MWGSCGVGIRRGEGVKKNATTTTTTTHLLDNCSNHLLQVIHESINEQAAHPPRQLYVVKVDGRLARFHGLNAGRGAEPAEEGTTNAGGGAVCLVVGFGPGGGKLDPGLEPGIGCRSPGRTGKIQAL